MKLGSHVDTGQMYRVYRNQAAAAYLSLYFFIFLSLQFTNIKMFRHTFQIYRVYRNQAAAAYLSLYFFIFLSLQFTNIKIFRHTFLRNGEA